MQDAKEEIPPTEENITDKSVLEEISKEQSTIAGEETESSKEEQPLDIEAEGDSVEAEPMALTGDVSLDKYSKAVKEVSGKYGGILGLGEISYSHTFAEEQKVYSPIYSEEKDGITTEYIVITNEQQLAAIGTNQPVVGGWLTVDFEKFWVQNGLNGHHEFRFKSENTENVTGDMGKSLIATKAPVSSSNGKIVTEEHMSGDILSVSIGFGNTGKKYASNENYLIANDIDLTGMDWKPLNFCGKIMRGEVTLTDGTTRSPMISNINVVEDPDSNTGVGFFGAIYSSGSGEDVKAEGNDRPWWDIIGNLLGGLAGLVSGLLGTVGGLVTDIVGSIAGWENITTLNMSSVEVSNIDLSNVVLQTDGIYETTGSSGGGKKHTMPVGAFAGQITGDVSVTNCHVKNAAGIKGYEFVGGFVGETVGATDYLLKGTTSGLEHTLEGLGSIVDGALDFLLPTDDLVTGLISKLGIGSLVPIKYKPAALLDCSVSLESVSAEESYAGGFVGRAQGTKIKNCHVTNVLDVSAKSNVGGFGGRVANAYVLGLLQGLGVNLVNFPVDSEVINCTVTGNNLSVTSKATEQINGKENAFAYAGGFVGAVMASDIIYDGTEHKMCGVTGLSGVDANANYVGGFFGYAGVGDLAEALNLLAELLNLELNLKSENGGEIEVPIGTDLSKLLNMLLGVNLNAGILSLIGLNASQLVGCRVEGKDYTVISSNGGYVGGFAGFLHGGQILEQPVEEGYDRVQATDKNGKKLFVNASAVTDSKGGAKGAVYARYNAEGNVIFEDVHGNPISVTTEEPTNKTTIYNVYDTVFINTSHQNTPTLMSSFKDVKWNSVVDDKGNPVTKVGDLKGHPNILFPVYQQAVSTEGYAQFTYHYVKDKEAAQLTLYRNQKGEYFTRDENGDYHSYANVNENKLSVDALQVNIEDNMIQTEQGTAVITKIDGLSQVKGTDYIGGVVGYAKLCSAVDLLSNLAAAQYERFEVNNVVCNGIAGGMTVEATGDHSRAGGAVGYAMGGDIVNVQVKNLKSVSAKSYAGGFGGQIIPGTVAGQDGSGLKLLGLVSIKNLLTVVDAVHTFINDSVVEGASSGLIVSAKNVNQDSAAAGFVAWSINTKYNNCRVVGLQRAEADGYAGGFCAVADCGSIAGVLDKTFGGVDLSNLLGLGKVLSLINALPNEFQNCTVNLGETSTPYTVRASAYSTINEPGKRISASDKRKASSSLGSAGGFLGYGTAVQVENCANENLESVDATAYAGGFGGFVDIGSVAQIGNAGILGQIAKLTGIATLLDCSVSTVKTSHSQGTAGGYVITAFDRIKAEDGSWTDEGIAGGFIGNLEGSHIEGCYANHIDKVQGENYAGGFIGRMVSGDVAKVAESTSLINEIVKIDGGLLGALQVMVPSVKNSYAKCVPCGGTILSYGTDYQQLTDTTTKVGVAGGYVGLNSGGQIWGNYDKNVTVFEKNPDTGKWESVVKHTAIVKDRENQTADYSGNAVGHEAVVYGTGQTCDILQLLKVDSNLYAGGYSGYTKAAELAALGEIDLLSGILDLGEFLSVGQVVVPTQRNTGVTGALRNVTQAQMDYLREKNTASGNIADFSNYYGYTVGNQAIVDANKTTSASGGYCGVMTTGVIENAVAYDLISAEAEEQAGGFAGAILTGGVAQAELEKSLLGGLLSDATTLGENLLGVANAVVPVIKNSGVYGFYSGSKISAINGNAGGFVGTSKGGQIWGDVGERPAKPVLAEITKEELLNEALQAEETEEAAKETSLKSIRTRDSKETLQTEAAEKETPLKSIQTEDSKETSNKALLESKGDEESTSKKPELEEPSKEISEGASEEASADTALAVADMVAEQAEATQLIKTYEPIPNHCFTKNLRCVTAKGLTADAGGFVGYMGAASIASLGGLGLLGDLVKLPSNFVSLCSATVPTVYYADVAAPLDGWGYIVTASGGRSAGGFAGFLQGAQVGIKEKADNFPELGNNSVDIPSEKTGTENITATGLRSVTAGDYAGGFFGYANAADTLNVKGTDEGGGNKNFTLLNLLTLGQISAVELAKSYIYNSSVTGIDDGYMVESLNAYAWKTADWNEDVNKAACAGGFGGLLQAGVVRYSMAKDLSVVSGRNYSGGFLGRMGKSSILKVNHVATSGNLGILSDLLGLGVGLGDVFGSHIQDSKLQGIQNGYAVISQNGYHNMAGGFVGYADVCRIKNCDSSNASLVQSDEIAGGFIGAMSDAMLLNVQADLLKKILEGVTVGLDLIKANRSKIINVSIEGVNTWDGLDIYGGGSSETGTAVNGLGYAGSFIGLNFGSTVAEGTARYIDTVKGSDGKINPYVGANDNTALLANLELDVLLELIHLDGDWSKSDISGNKFETRKGSSSTPSGAAPVEHAATDSIGALETPYYISDSEADLLIEQITNTLTVKKELTYETGAIPNIGDMDYTYTIDIKQGNSIIKTIRLSAGEFVSIPNLSGTYTVSERADVGMPRNIIPAEDITVTVAANGNTDVVMLNTVKAPPKDPNATEDVTPAYAATSGKFIVNHIPTGDIPPIAIENPCELLDEVPKGEVQEPLAETVTVMREEEIKDDTEE